MEQARQDSGDRVMDDITYVDPPDSIDIPLETKVAEFDKLYALAKSYLDSVRLGEVDDNDEHYIFEAVIGLLGNDVWKVINVLIR